MGPLQTLNNNKLSVEQELMVQDEDGPAMVFKGKIIKGSLLYSFSSLFCPQEPLHPPDVQQPDVQALQVQEGQEDAAAVAEVCIGKNNYGSAQRQEVIIVFRSQRSLLTMQLSRHRHRNPWWIRRKTPMWLQTHRRGGGGGGRRKCELFFP